MSRYTFLKVSGGLLAVSVLWVMSTREATAQQSGDNANFQGCYARWTDKQLVIGNQHIERTWAIEDGTLRPTGYLDREAHLQWLSQPSRLPAPRLGNAFGEPDAHVMIAATHGAALPEELPSLSVTVKSTVAHGIRYVFHVFPKARGISMSVEPESGEWPTAQRASDKDDSILVDAFTMREADPAKQTPEQKQPEDQAVIEDLSLAPQNLRLTQVSLADDSDQHNELVSTREWMFMTGEAEIFAHGDLLFAEDVVTGNGLIFLKMAPLPRSRTVDKGVDFHVVPGERIFRMLGLSYPEIIIAYRGGRGGRIAALQTYQQQLRRYVPGRDGRFLTNTWGDRSQDTRIREAFIHQEIDAGAKLGVDVAQIDAGWQKGRRTSEFGDSGFWASSSTFWDVNPQRFPRGIQPLVDYCAAHGMKLGLWYGPDSTDQFANWERDAARVLDLYRKYGISYFKFDLMKVNTLDGDRNLHALVDRVLSGSQGAVSIDLDITGADKRPGYFGLMNAGPLFVENRYTDSHRYWPHITLRNLWNLSQFIDPVRLRMEFLNNERNQDKYVHDPLAPSQYTADALFASVMIASPVGWFENSNLSPSYIKAVAPLVAVWKRERDRLYRGVTIPVGDEPDGISWTGFASINQNQSGGYLLVFRELNDSPERSFPLSMFNEKLNHVNVLAGKGTARILGASVQVQIPEKLQYLWVRLN